jgi:glutamate--cysteine ligase
MNWDFSKMVSLFMNYPQSKLLLDGKFGIEKESQRVTSAGDLALTSHPVVFGDKLTNPRITTDFSESQVEMVTPPVPSVKSAYQSLSDIQSEVEAGIGDEFLWPLSMPPRLPEEKDIPIARFKDSEAGKEKEVYRKGLALRYGKKMQMISGIHYNFSFGSQLMDYLYRHFGNDCEKQDFYNDLYFATTRNFLRYRWLLIYLFGASPSVDATYYSVINQDLKTIAQCCPEWCSVLEQYKQYATSLRVSRFGYVNTTREGAHIYFNDLKEYITNLRKLLSTKSREFAQLGLFQNGSQIQLNDNVIQKESEFYAPIRFKHVARLGETNLEALEKGGVQYLEIRILDLNPFEKVGVGLSQLYFLQVFMVFCLFESSTGLSETEMEAADKNHQAVALFGRRPKLELDDYRQRRIGFLDWSGEIFLKLQIIARLMDQAGNENIYQTSVRDELKKITDMKLLPSARIQQEMVENRESFVDFGIRRSMLNQSSHKKSQKAGNQNAKLYGYGTFHPDFD